jgi:hypothetical protein
MKKAVYLLPVILTLGISLGAQERQPVREPGSPVDVQSGEPTAHPRLYRETWYDYLIRQFNPNGVNWGRWVEERRQAFLQSTAANPFFKYSLVVTCLLLIMAGALAKVWIDKRRVIWLAQEQFDDLGRHDQYSRKAARDAIERYNRHMEKCNRAVEAELAGRVTAGGFASQQDADQKLHDALVKLAQTERERAALEAKLERTSAVVGDLTVRLNGAHAGGNGHSAAEAPSGAQEYKTSELVKQISELQQQLHYERERNKRLKGM